jgi:hypothetical protein
LALSPQDLIEACKDIQNGQLLFFIVRTVQSFPQEQRTPATLQWIASTLQDETVAGDTTVTFEQLPQEEKTVEILEEIISLFKTMKDQDKYTKAIVLNTFRDLPQEERNLQALKTLFSLLGTMDGRSAMLCIKASCEIQKGKVHFLEALSIVAPFFQGLPLALHDQQFPLK